MQNITQAQKDYLWAGGPLGVTITVDPLDVTPFTVTEDDLVEGSLTIERNWALGNVIEVGCSDTSELIFSLDNSDGQWNTIRWEGARLTVVLDIGGEPLQAGIFTVDERPGKLTTMQIKALDDMAKFNKPYDTDLAYPATLEQILVDACTKCNVTQHTLTFNNGAYTVTEKPVGDDITYHHIVAWVAELAGCNAWIDQLGRLQLGWYTDIQTELLEIGPNERYEYEMAEEDIEITGIVYRDEDTDYVVGTDRYALIIEENLLLQDNFEPVLSAIYTKIGGFRYRPYTFKVLASPHLWPGDVITKVTDAHGNELSSIIMKHMFKLADSSIAAVGETETVRGYATGAPFTASQKRVLQSVAKAEASRQTSSLEQATLQLNELMVNSLGFYTTTIESSGGGKVVYTHDKPLLTESQIIWTRTEQGFAWTDSGWNAGSPVWQYGVASDGNMIIKLLTAIGINAEWIKAGTINAVDITGSRIIGGEIIGVTGTFHGLVGTTENMYFVVDGTTGDDNNPGTSALPFKTIQKAIDMIPFQVNHYIGITIRPGDYTQVLTMSGYLGEGTIHLHGKDFAQYTVPLVEIEGVSCRLSLWDCAVVGYEGLLTENAFTITNCREVSLNNCEAVYGPWAGSHNEVAFNITGDTYANISECSVSGGWFAAVKASNGARVYTEIWDVSNDSNYGFWATSGGMITPGSGNQPTGWVGNELVGDPLSLDGSGLIHRLIETGSNENGHWRKWSDGTMECWHEGIATYLTTNSLIFYWTYPQGFVEEPDVQLTIIHPGFRGYSGPGSTSSVGISYIREIGTTSVRVQVQSVPAAGWVSDDERHVKCRAIGRWRM